jgi:dephospho-CoA kinase
MAHTATCDIRRLIGITGGIGSGKTTVCRELEKHGYPIYYCDERAKSIMRNNSQVQKAIIELLGSDAYSIDKQINKRYIAQRVFTERSLIHQLNAIVHPAVKHDIIQWLDEQCERVCFVESAIIFESEINKLCDCVINISADTDERIRRTTRRDNVTQQQVIERIEAQMSDEERQKRADITIFNHNGQQIDNVAQQLLAALREKKLF